MKHYIPLFALALLASCKTGERANPTLRVGYAAQSVDDDFGTLDAVDISTLNGGEAQLIFETDAENLGVVGFAGFGSREVTTDIANIGGIPASAERAYFGVGAHYTHHFSEQFRGFFQGGIMHQSGKFSLAGVSQSETALGLFVAAGFEAMMSDSVSLVLTARPLEPSLDFDGVDVDSTTFTVGVGLKL